MIGAGISDVGGDVRSSEVSRIIIRLQIIKASPAVPMNQRSSCTRDILALHLCPLSSGKWAPITEGETTCQTSVVRGSMASNAIGIRDGKKHSRPLSRATTMLCPNCGSRLDATGTCRKCWWRTPTAEPSWSRRKAALAIAAGVGLATLAMLGVLGIKGCISGLITNPQ
jgi:hypothetical protein